MMKFNTFGFAFFSMLFIISTLNSVVAAAEYSLGVSEGDECSWNVIHSDGILFQKYEPGDVMHFEVNEIGDEGDTWKIQLEDPEKYFRRTFWLYKSPEIADFLCPVPVKSYLGELDTPSNGYSNAVYSVRDYNLTVEGVGITTQKKVYEDIIRHYSYDNTTGWATYMKYTYQNGTIIFEISEINSSKDDGESSFPRIAGYESWFIIGLIGLATIIIFIKTKKRI